MKALPEGWVDGRDRKYSAWVSHKRFDISLHNHRRNGVWGGVTISTGEFYPNGVDEVEALGRAMLEAAAIARDWDSESSPQVPPTDPR